MPTATALRCFIAALEEQSEDGKPVGGGRHRSTHYGATEPRTVRQPAPPPDSPLLTPIPLPEPPGDRCHRHTRGSTGGRDVFPSAASRLSSRVPPPR